MKVVIFRFKEWWIVFQDCFSLMCFSAVILVHHLKAVSLQIFYHQGYKFICQCGGKKVASSSFKNRLSIWGQDVGINTSYLTRRRIYSSILWVGALKVSTKLSQLMCRLFKVSLKSVVEDDFLDPLHLGVCLTSAFHGYSSTVFFFVCQFHHSNI